MGYLVIKYGITAAVVVLISELAKRLPRVGGLLAALPLVTLLTMTWMHLEHVAVAKLAAHARYTFYYVLPTLPMFWLMPALLARLKFGWAMLAGVGITATCFIGFAAALKRVGVVLW